MLLWFAGTAVAAVWAVFRDPAFDYRLVIVGALLPDLVDLPFGGARAGHALVTSVALLAAVMLVTRGRRVLRRRLLAVPIGSLLHLVFDAAWSRTEVFWWPAFGWSFGDVALPAVDRGWSNVALEVAGLALLVWAWRRFRLAEPERRSVLLRTGHVGRDLAG